MEKNQYLPSKKLQHGYLYQIKARNSSFGVWNENKSEFVISRFKFMENYTFEEIHYEASDMHGTAYPLKELEKCPYDPENYNEKDMLEYLNKLDPLQCPECGFGKDEWIRHDPKCSERTKTVW